ncbi:MAG: saccharopine dehydrogenase family protein [Sulfurifustis sp.]
MTDNFLLYGSYGYTGALILELALRQGLRPLLGGRNAGALEQQARTHGLDFRAFDVNDRAAAVKALTGMRAVLNCAGPFHRTAIPMVQACLATGVHYLDITGEITVYEALATQDEAARRAKIMLLPGCGLDVVPTDCVAAHLKTRLPDATDLILAFQSSGGFSRGTAITAIENIHRGGAVRKNGVITPVPAAWKTREVDFGNGPILSVTIPWGDVSTAFYTTGIGNIEVYTAMPTLVRQIRMTRYIGWLLALPPIQHMLKRRIKAGPAGPDAETRAKSSIHVWGQVRNAAGRTATTRLHTMNGYVLTALASVRAVQNVLAGQFKAGFQTPARAYGADFVLQFEGVRREDLEPPVLRTVTAKSA